MEVPDGITLVALPADSPELQPAEHLWPLIDEAVANRVFDCLGELEATLRARICVLSNRVEKMRLTTLFHWRPRVQPQ